MAISLLLHHFGYRKAMWLLTTVFKAACFGSWALVVALINGTAYHHTFGLNSVAMSFWAVFVSAVGAGVVFVLVLLGSLAEKVKSIQQLDEAFTAEAAPQPAQPAS